MNKTENKNIQLLLNDKIILKEKKATLKTYMQAKKEFLKSFNFDDILAYNINFYDYECYTSEKNKCYVYNLFTMNKSEKNLLNNFIDLWQNTSKLKVIHGASQYAPEQKKIMLIFTSKANLKRKFLKTELNHSINELKLSIEYLKTKENQEGA